MRSKLNIEVRGNSPKSVKDEVLATFENHFGEFKPMKSDNYYSSSACFGRTVDIPATTGIELIKFLEKFTAELFTPLVSSIVLNLSIKGGIDLFPSDDGVRTTATATLSHGRKFSYSLTSEVDTTYHTPNVVNSLTVDPARLSPTGKALCSYAKSTDASKLVADPVAIRRAVFHLISGFEPCSGQVVGTRDKSLVLLHPKNGPAAIGFVILARMLFGDGSFIADINIPSVSSHNIEGTTVYLRHRL